MGGYSLLVCAIILTSFLPFNLKSQYILPSVPENFTFGFSSSIMNTGNESLAFQGDILNVMVANGNNAMIAYDFGYGLLTGDLPLGFDNFSSQSVVFQVSDPDISGVVNPNNSDKARFIAVYTGLDAFNLNIHVWYEVWEFDFAYGPQYLIQIQEPRKVTNSGEVYSPNVDVSVNGQIAVGYNYEGELHIKAGLDLFDLAQVSNDLDASTTGNGSLLTNIASNSCDYFIGNTWIDVSITEDGVGCNRFNLTYNYKKGSGVASAGGEFNTIYSQTISQNTINDCSGIFDFDLDLNVTGGKSFGLPRIASPSPLASNQGIDCNEYAVTFSEINNGGEIIVLKANESMVLASDVANVSPTNNMCYNGLPSISFNFDSDIITIAWEFYDCNYCIPGNVECPAGGPINVQTKLGYYILSRRYDPSLNRLYHDINVVSDVVPSAPAYRYPSVAGRHGYGSDLLFTYPEGNSDHLTYKPSDLLSPSLMKIFTNNEEVFFKYDNKLLVLNEGSQIKANLKLSKPVTRGTISLFDINGKLIFSNNLNNLTAGSYLYILPELLANSVYFITFNSMEVNITEKFVFIK